MMKINSQSIGDIAFLESRTMMAGMVQGMADVVVVIDHDGMIRFINDAGENLTGYPLSELVGTSIARIVSDDDLQFSKTLTRLMKKGSAERCVLSLLSRSGEKISATFNGSVLCNGSGEVESIVGVIRDMSEVCQLVDELSSEKNALEKKVRERTVALEKATEIIRGSYENLSKTQSQLIQAEKLSSLGQLAAGVAHEINNPVGFVKSNLERMEEYLKDILLLINCYGNLLLGADRKDEKGLRFELKQGLEKWEQVPVDFLVDDIQKIVKESRDGILRVEKIVAGLKDFSHVDQTKWQCYNLNKGLETTLNMISGQLQERIEVLTDFGEIPEIPCNPQQFHQVFMNLILNAMNAIQGKGQISVRSRTCNKNIEIEISDTGRGIPKEIVGKVFDPFFTTKTVGQGTGLGLSVAYGIVKKHWGKIEVESEQGQGTTFRIVIPT